MKTLLLRMALRAKGMAQERSPTIVAGWGYIYANSSGVPPVCRNTVVPSVPSRPASHSPTSPPGPGANVLRDIAGLDGRVADRAHPFVEVGTVVAHGDADDVDIVS